MSSIRAKLAAVEARIAKLSLEAIELAAKAEREVDPATLQGQEVTYTIGRGDSRRESTGRVLGVSFPAEGAKGAPIVRILAGEGANSRIDSVFVSAISGVATSA